MKPIVTKVDRLVRLDHFNQERAEGSLRQASVMLVESEREHREAILAMEGLGAWKSNVDARGGLDLAMYEAVLTLEATAMTECNTLKADMEESERGVEAARDSLREAATSSRVSERRQKTRRAEAAVVEEKKIFDQIADVWLNNREARHD
jgi:hypothetical protein